MMVEMQQHPQGVATTHAGFLDHSSSRGGPTIGIATTSFTTAPSSERRCSEGVACSLSPPPPQAYSAGPISPHPGGQEATPSSGTQRCFPANQPPADAPLTTAKHAGTFGRPGHSRQNSRSAVNVNDKPHPPTAIGHPVAPPVIPAQQASVPISANISSSSCCPECCSQGSSNISSADGRTFCNLPCCAGTTFGFPSSQKLKGNSGSNTIGRTPKSVLKTSQQNARNKPTAVTTSSTNKTECPACEIENTLKRNKARRAAEVQVGNPAVLPPCCTQTNIPNSTNLIGSAVDNTNFASSSEVQPEPIRNHKRVDFAYPPTTSTAAALRGGPANNLGYEDWVAL